MVWLRIEDSFTEHPKVMDLSDRSFRLHMTALCYCSRNLTDGVISTKALRVISALVTSARTTANVAELVAANLWRPIDGGHEINDFLRYNPPAEKVKKDRDDARERMRTRRERSAEQNGERSAEQTGHVRGPQSQTSPKGESLSGVSEGDKHGPDDLEIGEELEHAVVSLIVSLRHSDKFTERTIRRYQAKLPPAAFWAAREEMRRARPHHDAKYVVSLLKRWVEEGRYAA